MGSANGYDFTQFQSYFDDHQKIRQDELSYVRKRNSRRVEPTASRERKEAETWLRSSSIGWKTLERVDKIDKN